MRRLIFLACPKSLRQQATPKGKSASGMWPNGSLQLARSGSERPRVALETEMGGTEDGVVCLEPGLPAHRRSLIPPHPPPLSAAGAHLACRMDRSWPLVMTKAWSRLSSPSAGSQLSSCNLLCQVLRFPSLQPAFRERQRHMICLSAGRATDLAERLSEPGESAPEHRAPGIGHTTLFALGTWKADQCPALQRLRDLARRRML